MKYILLALFSLCSLIAKEDPKKMELAEKLNKLEHIKKNIAEKEAYIDRLSSEGSDLFYCLFYGYDKEQRDLIWLELNKLEQYIAHALNNNINVEKAVQEPLCPSLTVHRNELDRLQHMTVRVCIEYFLLMKLYKQYHSVALDIYKIQFES